MRLYFAKAGRVNTSTETCMKLSPLTAGPALESALTAVHQGLQVLDMRRRLTPGTAGLHAHLPRPLSLGSRLRERDLLPSFFL